MRSGQLSTGPFDENAGDWTDASGAKFWVASAIDEPAGVTAAITADQSASSRSVRVVRIATERAKVPDLPTFFPGLLRLPAHGTWQIHVTIGTHTGCFVVHASARSTSPRVRPVTLIRAALVTRAHAGTRQPGGADADDPEAVTGQQAPSPSAASPARSPGPYAASP